MKFVGERDPFGLKRLYYERDGDAAAGTVRELLRRSVVAPALDREGVLAQFAGRPLPQRTCFAGIRSVPAGHALWRDGPSWQIRPVEWCGLSSPRTVVRGLGVAEVLAGAVRHALAERSSIALALSGGLDSALVLALVRRLGESVPVYTLDPQLPGYSELTQTRRTAAALGVELNIVRATESDFVEALPACVGHAEVPFYNLHPVSKYLLARRLHADGIRVVLTGDGADQVFGGAPAAIYLPIVGALFDACAVEVRSPYLDAGVIACARNLAPDPEKQCLRAAARGLVPEAVAEAPKTPRLAPPVQLGRYWQADKVAAIAVRLGLDPPRIDSDRDLVNWVTLTLLYEQLIERL